jgi:hypothetical protein
MEVVVSRSGEEVVEKPQLLFGLVTVKSDHAKH